MNIHAVFFFLGFHDFVNEFQTISINNTGIFTRELRTEFLSLSSKRTAGHTKRNTGVWMSTNSYVRCRTKVENVNYFTVRAVCFDKDFVSRWALQSVALEQIGPEQQVVDSVLRQRTKL